MGASLIGQLRILLGLETAKLETGAKVARKELLDTKAVAEGLKKTLDMVGISLGAVAFAEYAKSALEYASSLETTAQRIGVTVEQLQVMRKAARDTGVAQDAMEQGLARLQLRLGQAKAGLPDAVKAFKDIGISRAQLQSFHDAGDVLPLVEEGLHKVGDGSTRAAAGQELLSRAALTALPVFAMGKKAYDEMYDSAVKSGLITAEEAHKAHEAQDAVEDLSIALKTKLAIALAENADEIVHFVEEIEKLINKVSSAFYYIAQLRTELNKVSAAGNDLRDKLLLAGGQIGIEEYQARHAENKRQFNKLDAEETDRRYLSRGRTFEAMFPEMGHHERPPGPPPDHLDLTPHHKGHDHSEQRAKEAEKLQYELDKQTLDEKKQLLEAQRDLTIDTEDRNSLGLDILQVEHDQRALELKHNLKMVELDRTISAAKKAEAETSTRQALEQNDRLLNLRIQGANLQAELERERQFEQTEQASFHARTDRLQLESELAKTMAERRKVELEILNASYEEKKQVLERIINEQYQGQFTHNADDRARAQIELNALTRNYGLNREKVLNSTAGPLEQMLSNLPTTADQINEALQSLDVQAVNDLNDSLAQTAARFIHLGGIAGRVLQDLYAGVIKILLARYVDAPVAGFLGKILGIGSTVAELGGISKGAVPEGTGLPKFADGGEILLGGMAGIDTNRLSLNGMPIAQVTRGEKLSITPANDHGDGTTINLTQNNNFAGGAATMQDVVMMGQVATSAALKAVSEANRRR